MNVLLIGRNKMVLEQLSSITKSITLVFDESFDCRRDVPEFKDYPIIDSHINISTLLGVLPRAKEIMKWQKQYDVDVIYTNAKWDMLAAKIASIFSKKKVVLVSTSHNSYAWQNKRSVWMMSFLIKRTTDVYVSLALFVYNSLIKNHLKNEHLLLLPNTINSKVWMQKSSYDINECFRIVYVAYVYPAKRQDFILKVLSVLADKYSIEVDCYGDVDNESDYVRQILDDSSCLRLSERFHLCGRVENEMLRDQLCQYDMYFCPSDMEMSPVNILEAQAAGLPILASKVGGIPDLIIDNVTGLLYESGNVNDAVQKILLLICDAKLRERLGRSAHEYVTNIYTPESAGELFKHKINLILNK